MNKHDTSVQLPLSQAQLGIWLGHSINPDSALYNAAELIEIKGCLDIDLFRRALKEVYQSAEALNVVFTDSEVEPIQTVVQHAFVLERIDVSDAENSLLEAKQWCFSQLSKRIQLDVDPPFRNALIRLGEHHFGWFQCIHHIAADGYSFAMLSQKVAERYQQLCLDSSTFFKAGFGSLEKVLEEDNEYEQSKRRQKSAVFWRDYLTAVSVPVSLSKQPQNLKSVNQLAIESVVELNAPEFDQLKLQASRLELSWADWIMATVATFLSIRTAVKCPVMGVPTMGRMGSTSLRVPSMVMNINPLAVSLELDDRFCDVALRVQENLKMTRRHQKFRYEQLRQLMNVSAEKKVFGPIVNIMPFDRHLSFGNTQTNHHSLSAGPVEDLSFAFVPDGQRLRTIVQANPNGYTQSDLTQITHELHNWLVATIENPERPIKPILEDLSYLAGESLRLVEYNVVKQIQLQVERHATHTAIENLGKQYSYQQLAKDVETFALGLALRAVTAGQLVCLTIPRSYSAIVASLGVLRVGACFTFVDAHGPALRNKTILETAKPNIIVTNKAADSGSQAIATASFESIMSAGRNSSKSKSDLSNVSIEMSMPAYVVFTSGSTGTPKGVQVPHQALAEFVRGATKAYPVLQADRVMQFAPLHFDTFIEEVFCTLCTGATLMLRSEAATQSVPTLLEECEAKKISILDLPTSYWHELVYACTYQHFTLPDCIHTLIIGGEAVSPERVAQWHRMNKTDVRLLNTYGPSEATVVTSFLPILPDEPISIGEPLANRFIAVVNEYGQPIPRGQLGELVIGGQGLASGYLNSVEQSQQRFSKLPVLIPEAHRAYWTGDRCYIGNDSKVYFEGRIDDEIKISGHRIQPLEIENAIHSLACVEDCVVIAQTKPNGSDHLHAFVVSSHESNELRLQLSDRLPSVMIPSVFHKLSDIPKNVNGKVDRTRLASAIQAGTDPTESLEDLSENEAIVARVWQEILGCKSIQKKDDFFRLGGVSLQAIKVMNRLNVITQKQLPLDTLFNQPSLSAFTRVFFDEPLEGNEQNLAEQVLLDSVLPLSEFPERPPLPQVNGLVLKHIILTGASGFVGVQLLQNILMHTTAQVTALIRAQNQEQAVVKIHQAMVEQSISVLNWKSRVQIVLADLEQPNLGLTSEQFTDLQNQCDLILHNAAKVSVMQDYQSLKRANVNSTLELLRLAKHRRIPLHYVSTIATAFSPKYDSTPEEFVAWHTGLKDGYQQSKWGSERLIEQAQSRGYPAVVYRLGRITGDTETGYVNNNDLVWNMIRAAVRNGAVPDFNIEEPWTAVNEVANAIVTLCQQPDTQGVYNLLPESNVSTKNVFAWLRELQPNLVELSFEDWVLLVSKSDDTQDITLSEFFKSKASAIKTPSFNHGRFKQGFKVIEKDDFTRYWRYWCHNNRDT